jgi:GNAT superfamily N-acetyltransferase
VKEVAEIGVRRAALEDLEMVLDLWQEMMDYHARLDRRFLPAADGRDHFRITLREWMGDDTCRVLVAVDHGDVVGYIIGRLAENPPVFENRYLGHVSDICVAPEWRHMGVGRKLFGALRNWFWRQGLTSVQLHVGAFNPVSQAFWREMGFQDYMHRLWLEI